MAEPRLTFGACMECPAVLELALLKVYIGYDPRETAAYHVLSHSILRQASRPVSITPIALSQLSTQYLRPRDKNQSTDFTYARFLTPYLANGGVSVFMDCDMLCRTDICELEDIAHADPYQDVFVVQHDYTPKHTAKFLGNRQVAYPRKNWSSLMVFNGHRMRVRDLVPHYVALATPMELHQFKWATEIGSLPKEWNHLVGEYAPNPNAKLVHFTLGGPWFPRYRRCEYAREWFREHKLATLY